MTTPSLDQLQADAGKISVKGSPMVAAYAKDTVAYLRALDERVAALEAAPVPAPAPTPTPNPPAPAMPVPVGALMFEETFDAPLDKAMWDVKNRVNKYSGTTFTPANVSVHDGLLDILGTKDASGATFGGEIQAMAPAYQYSGPRYMEASAKLPTGAGVWPAPIWELDAPQPPNWTSIGIENDVCEQLGTKEPTRYHVTLHTSTSASFGIAIETGIDLSLDFHLYGSAIYDDRADVYFDRKLMATIPKSAVTAWPFTTTPMVAMIDLDLGGAWAGPATFTPPVHLLVQDFRVWKLVL